MKASKKRTWFKNLTRSLLVGFTVILTVLIDKKIGKFVGIIGALTCTPIAFTWPSLFHYKLAAKNKTEKMIDIILFIFSLFIFVYSTY